FSLTPRGSAPPLSFTPLTFRRGVVLTARFAPDGHTVVYGAGWDGDRSRVFSARLESPESSPGGLPDGTVLSISPSNELAMLIGRMYVFAMPPRTLARVPLAGGAAREVAEDVVGADWGPDGRSLAIARVRIAGANAAGATMEQWTRRKFQLEFPIGKVLYEASESGIWQPRVSPAGDRVAFIEERPDGNMVQVVDLEGRARTLVRLPEGRAGAQPAALGDRVVREGRRGVVHGIGRALGRGSRGPAAPGRPLSRSGRAPGRLSRWTRPRDPRPVARRAH